MFGTYTSHCNIMNEKLTECADALVETDSSIMNDITEAIVQITETSTQSSTLTSEYVNPYDPDNLPDKTLYDTKGVLTFYQNGKFVKETFCNIPLKYSLDLKFLILKLGYDAGFWYRDDGV